MITPYEVYLVTILDGVGNFLSVMAFICAISGGLLIFACCIFSSSNDMGELDKDIKYLCGWTAGVITASVVLFLSSCLLPSTNQMAAILIIPKIANSDFAKEAQHIPADLTKLAEKYIQDKIMPVNKDNK